MTLQVMRKPFIKFICNSASYFFFLFLLILASQRIEDIIGYYDDDDDDDDNYDDDEDNDNYDDDDDDDNDNVCTCACMSRTLCPWWEGDERKLRRHQLRTFVKAKLELHCRKEL